MRFTSCPAAVVSVALLGLASCRKDDYKLEGPVPTAGFTAVLDTSQYPVRVTFTNTTTDAFQYQWDFGDGSALASGRNVTHTYTQPFTYTVRLITSGRGGTGDAKDTEIIIPSRANNPAFAALTATGSWTFTDQPGAIQTLDAAGNVLTASTAPLADCASDDVFSFGTNFTYSYDAGEECNPVPGHPLSGQSDYVYKIVNGVGEIILQRNGAFIGTPDSVQNKTYRVVQATAALLVLEGTRPDGSHVRYTLVPQLPKLQLVERYLTGGSSRTWVMDNTVAAAVTVGPEATPTLYYAGEAAGGLNPCQVDDEYTFTTARNLTYDAKAQTYGAGPYTCQAPRNYTTAYTYGPANGAGEAQIVLANPNAFIGTVDAAADHIYRILSITSRKMVIRGGAPTAGSVFTIKMRVK